MTELSFSLSIVCFVASFFLSLFFMNQDDADAVQWKALARVHLVNLVDAWQTNPQTYIL